jgi:putative tryptophan/tyrosine transport system substrate-binding protein
LVPALPRIAILVNPNNRTVETDVSDVQAAALAVGQQIDVLRAANEREIDQAFRTMAQQRSDALLVAHDPFFNSRREQLVTLAAYLAIPAIYEFREFVAAGGLMSYGTKLTENYRLAGLYAGRILKGANPAELPVQQPTKFELVWSVRSVTSDPQCPFPRAYFCIKM